MIDVHNNIIHVINQRTFIAIFVLKIGCDPICMCSYSLVQNKKSLLGLFLQDQIQMRVVCSGRVTALTTTPDGNYCIAAVREKIHVWQVTPNTGYQTCGR